MENTCLHQATLKGDAKMIALLLAASGAGAPPIQIDAPGRDGWTALCLAARSGNVPAAKALLGAGADAGLRMASGKTALEIATLNKKASMVALLSGAAPNGSKP